MFYYFHDKYRFETRMICSINDSDPEDEDTFWVEVDEQKRPCKWIYLDELRQEDEVYEPIGKPIDIDNIGYSQVGQTMS